MLLLELLLASSPLALIQQPATASVQFPYKVVYRAYSALKQSLLPGFVRGKELFSIMMLQWKGRMD